MLDLVSMHENVVTTCFNDVSMKYIHARVDGLIGRIFRSNIACIYFIPSYLNV